ncbi:methionyl-tRNA formyltransferase [Candidatus Peregrinibacteria bacterium]|nr:methionyl-tRNA formyltransferase [Candidatus Peregrinibacteria bacterium]
MSALFHVVFCGTPLFAVPALKALTEDPTFMVDLVITQPDRPQGRRHAITPPPVKTAAERLGLPIFQPQNINEELLPYLHSQFSILNFQFLVVVAYGQILSQEVLDLPRIAPVNLHASLLPRWRGASPIEHAVLAGDRETGVTIQSMRKELDAGPILAQERLLIGPEESTEDLRERLAKLGAQLLAHTLKSTLHPIPQPLTGITLCHKLSRKSGTMDPATMSAETIHRAVRALTPWPGVRIPRVPGEELTIIKSSLLPDPNAIALPCADHTILYLQEVQSPGKKAMTGMAWLRGQRSRSVY